MPAELQIQQINVKLKQTSQVVPRKKIRPEQLLNLFRELRTKIGKGRTIYYFRRDRVHTV